MNDYRRPSQDQIENHYRCSSCGSETSASSYYAGPAICYCGGALQFVGESYPADSRDWNEERDNVNDDFRDSRRRW